MIKTTLHNCFPYWLFEIENHVCLFIIILLFSISQIFRQDNLIIKMRLTVVDDTLFGETIKFWKFPFLDYFDRVYKLKNMIFLAYKIYNNLIDIFFYYQKNEMRKLAFFNLIIWDTNLILVLMCQVSSDKMVLCNYLK